MRPAAARDAMARLVPSGVTLANPPRGRMTREG
jgi:hypothetical protein